MSIESILFTNEIINTMYIEIILLAAIFLCTVNYGIETKGVIGLVAISVLLWGGLVKFGINIDFENQNQLQMFDTNTFALLAKTIIGFFVLYIINLIKFQFSFYEFNNKKLVKPDDKIILILYNWLGLCIILSTKDWFLLFLGIELVALTSYALIAWKKNTSAIALEAGIKYLIIGAFSTSLLLLSIFLIITTFLKTGIIDGQNQATNLIIEFSGSLKKTIILLLISSFLLKLGASPFHMWVADVYEGAPTPVTMLLAVPVKLGLFFTFIKILNIFFLEFYTIKSMLILTSILSLFIGCYGAIFQKKIKRMLAYSSINNLGFAMAGIASGTLNGTKSAIIYLIFYSLALTLVLTMLLSKSQNENIIKNNEKTCKYNSKKYYQRFGNNKNNFIFITDLKELTTFNKIILTLTLFSLAGIPPLTGFFTKLLIFNELINSQMYLLLAIAAVASTIGSYYYIHIIKVMYFENNKYFMNSPKKEFWWRIYTHYHTIDPVQVCGDWKNQHPWFLLNNYKLFIFIILMSLPFTLNQIELIIEYTLTEI